MLASIIVTCVVVVLVAVPLSMRKLKKPLTPSGNIVEGEKKKNIFDSLEARARANQGIKGKFGILNSFVSPDDQVRMEFRRAMITIKDSFHPSFFDDLIPDVISLFPDETTLKEIVQIVVMGSVLKGLLVTTLPSLYEMKTAAHLIDAMWSSEDYDETNRAKLHEIISAEDLSKFIPAWESQWRLVYYALLEYFRRSDDERKFALENPDLWVKETLRLYPPVKRVIRKTEQGEEISFSIVDRLRNSTEIWGDDHLVFNCRREYTKEQTTELRCVFGIGKLQCVAGLPFVLKFCGGILKKIGERYDCVEEERWREIESPLENRRDVSSYAQLLVCKKV